jgi:taurine dioxygenase
MRLRELSPALGCEVSDFDAAAPPRPSELALLRRALSDHHLLFFRAPGLGDREHVRLASHFGPVYDEFGDGRGWHFVSNARRNAIIRTGPLLFHSDLAFTPVPTPGLSLYGIEVPEDGAPTRFANAARALDALPAELRLRLGGLHGLHLYNLTTQAGGVRYRDAEVPAREPRAKHPVLLHNPRSGRDVLYVSEMQTDRIVELDPAESEAILAQLFAELYAPENIYEHCWRPGDLLIWDNLALQHARRAPENPRTLRRVTLARVGVPEQVPWFRSEDRAGA